MDAYNDCYRALPWHSVADDIMDRQAVRVAIVPVLLLEPAIGFDDHGDKAVAVGLVLQRHEGDITYKRIGLFHEALAEFFDLVEPCLVCLI